mgnify:FL=1
MKKLFTILLVVFLVVFSFVGCEKDKSEEVIKNYEDFEKTKGAMSKIASFSSLGGGKETELTAEKIDTNTLTSLVSSIENETRIVTEVVSAKGTILNDSKTEGVISYSTSTEIKGLEIKYKYTTANAKEAKEGSLTMSGTSSFDVKAVDEKTTEMRGTQKVSGLVINGTSYKDITFELSGNMASSKTTYTSATVGGKAVDVRLLNASSY